jgi:hypothetical protein
MMRTLILFFTPVFFFLISQAHLHGQQTPEKGLVRIVMTDGNEFIGSIERETISEVVIRTDKLGLLTIQRSDIKSLSNVFSEHFTDGEYWAPNPQSGRYFWSPTGYGLKQGEGYYQNLWVFFNQVSYGFSDNFSMGLGVMPLFLLGASSVPVWITPKIQFPLEPNVLNVGGGAIIMTLLGEDASISGILYGITTFGSRDKNLTLGLGWGFSDGEMANSPTINVSGMIRTGRRGYFLTENYLVNFWGENILILSVGGRTLWDRFSLDYGLFRPFVKDGGFEFIGFPWLGFVIPF